MNRIRFSVFAGLLALAGLALGASSAEAQYAAPRPTYAPGYAYYYSGGYYYPYYAPRPAPVYSYAPAPVYPSPGVTYGNRTMTTTSHRREWPTGRAVPLAKPWLQPLR